MANITDENRLVVTLTLADFKDALIDVLISNNYLKEIPQAPQEKTQEVKYLVPRMVVAAKYSISEETLDKWVKLKIFPKPVKKVEEYTSTNQTWIQSILRKRITLTLKCFNYE